MVRETTEELKTKIEKENGIISDQLKQKTLASYDIRDHVFQTVARDVCLKEESVKRVCFMHDVGIYHSTDNVLIRIAIGKKWAGKGAEGGYDYDYDASLISSIIMRDILFLDGTETTEEEKKGKIEHAHGYEYVISCEEGGKCITYRGDTMNSWSRTLDEYLRCFGGGDDGYFPSLEINARNKGKWRITEEDPARNWVDLLSIPTNYGKALPDYITDFMNVVYTIGNFIPLSPNFNTGRNRACQDYWDLTLLAIYNYYHGETNTNNWETLLGKSEDWLGNPAKENWDIFVRKNYLQPFVKGGGTKFSYESKAEEKVKEGYGPPKELWEGHFNFKAKNYRVPSTEEQFRSFFTNAAACINDRGKEIEKGLNKLYYNKEDA